jgi:hypothetical protein
MPLRRQLVDEDVQQDRAIEKRGQRIDQRSSCGLDGNGDEPTGERPSGEHEPPSAGQADREMFGQHVLGGEGVQAHGDAEGGGSPQQVLALGIDLAADEAHDLLADALQIGGPVPVGDEPASLHARLSSCCEASPPQEAGSSYMSSGPVWPTWSGRRTPVSPADRCTVGELLAPSDALARETLLDRTLDRAPAM